MGNRRLSPIAIQGCGEHIGKTQNASRALLRRNTRELILVEASHQGLLERHGCEALGGFEDFSALRPPQLATDDHLQLGPYPRLVGPNPKHERSAGESGGDPCP